MLGYGLNFIPSKTFFNKNNAVKDIDAFSRKVKLRAHFDQSVPDKNDIESKFYARNKTWEPQTTHHTVSTFLESFKRDAIEALDKAKPNGSTNLTTKEENALNNLMKRTDIIICKADKGGATVIIDVNDYIREAKRQLDDRHFYRKLGSDPTKSHLELVNKAIDSLQQRKHISDKLAAGLKMKEARTPLFYLLPKIHKTGHPGRPVVSSIECHTSKISEFVDHHLQPIVQRTTSYVKDTNDFINKLHTCSNMIDDDTILVTMDVTSLYTNIPNDEGMQAIRRFLSRAGKTVLIPVITKFLWLILTLNNFVFNGMHYLQTNGVSMGTKCAPEYANIFMANFEETYIYPRINGKCPLYLRYIDDIFLIWQGSLQELQDLIKEINSVHNTIKFEVNFSRSEVHFLDTTVTITPDRSIKTSLYQKPTDKHNFLHYKSYHPSSTKKSLPYSQSLRIRRICTSQNDYRSATAELKEQFKARGYNEIQVSQAIQKASDQDRMELLHPKPKSDKKAPLTLVTTFNKSLPNMNGIIEKNWNLLEINPRISKKFEEKPFIAYKRNPNLHQLIGGHRIEHGKVVKRTKKVQGKCTPCRSKQGNKCCKQMKSTMTFSNRHNNKTYKILHAVNCKDKNVIYLLECTKCDNKAYVGKSELPMNLRINGHRSDAKKTDKLAVDTHFLQPGHHFDRDAKFTIIEKITKTDLSGSELTSLLQRREDFWMLRLGTIAENGFNTALNFPS